MAEQITLLDLSFNTSEAADGLDALISKSITLSEKKAQLTKDLKAEEAALATVRKSFSANAIDQATYEAAVNKSSAAIVALTRKVNDNKVEITENNAAIKANTTIVNQGAQSTNGMRAQLALNTAALNKMTAEERLATDEGRKMSLQSRVLSDDLKRLESGIGDNRRNVGNYADDISKATASMGGLDGATGGMVKTMSGSIGGIMAFNTALAANPFLAMVSVTLLLINNIEKLTTRNSDLAASIHTIFAPLEWLISNVLNGIAEVFAKIGEVFEWVSKKYIAFYNALGLIPDSVNKAIEASKGLVAEERRIYNAQTDNMLVLARQRRELEEMKTVVADQTKSTKERNEAATKGLAILKEMRDAEVGVLEAQYNQIVAKKGMRKATDEERRAEIEALAAIEEKRAQYAGMAKELVAQRSGFEKAASDKVIADQKVAHDAAVKASEKLKAKREADEKSLSAAQKKIQEDTLKTFDTGIANLQLKIRERQVGITDKKLILENQNELNQAILQKERFRLDQGLITQQEFDNIKLQMAVENQEKMAVIQAEQDAQQKEREALNMANRRDLEAQNITNEFEQRQFQLDQRYQQELENANKIGADTTLVTKKYEAQKLDIAKARANAELTMSADLAGQMSNLLGQESKAGKAFAVVQATINTYLAATKAMTSLPYPFNIAAAAVTIASGLKQVATIVKVKSDVPETNTSVRKYAKGGHIYGAPHSQGGVTFTGSNGQRFEAEGGENMYILNRRASGAINALSALNVEYGGKSFGRSSAYRYADGGGFNVISSQAVGPSVKMSNPDVNLSSKTIAAIAQAFVEGVENAPNPVVSVQEFQSVEQTQTLIRESASN